MSRPLDDRLRRRLFWLAAAGIALAVLALSLLHQARTPAKPRGADAPPARVVTTPRPQPAPRPEPKGLSRAADRWRVAAVRDATAPVARRFAVAFVAYGDGDDSAAIRHELRATSTHRFAARLLASTPRLHGRPRPGRVASVRVSEDRSPAGLPVLVTVHRGGRTTQFPLLLRRTDAQWLVADLAG
jgi:hypothetical protein